MKADREQFFNLIKDYDTDCLRSLACSLYEELEELKLLPGYKNENAMPSGTMGIKIPFKFHRPSKSTAFL